MFSMYVSISLTKVALSSTVFWDLFLNANQSKSTFLKVNQTQCKGQIRSNMQSLKPREWAC